MLGAFAVEPARAQGGTDIYLPAGESVTFPTARRQVLRFSPRYGNLGSFDLQTIEPGVQRLVYTGGLIINVTYETGPPDRPVPQEYEFAADNLVLWLQGLRGADLIGGISNEPGPDNEKVRIELFLTGNVIIRNKDETVGADGKRTLLTRTLRADQIYYDVENSKAIATLADLELKFDSMTDAVHLKGERIERLGVHEWKAYDAQAFSSKLPSDPSLRLLVDEATLTEEFGQRTNIFGVPYRTLGTWEPDIGPVRTLTASNARVNVLGLPVFYTPYMKTDVAEPIGPLRGVGVGNDRIFGAQLYSTWDLYKLFALRGPPGHKWLGNFDWFSKRGFGTGSDYDYYGPDFFGLGGNARGQVRLYGIADNGTDILGGFRGPEPTQPNYRGRALWRHQQELFADRDADGLLCDRYLTLQGSFAYLSDKNFLEQYYKQEFDTGLNYETFAYLSGSRGQYYGSLLAQGGLTRDWITEAQWLPNLNGAIVGQSFWDILQYEARAGAGYGRLLPSTVLPSPYLPTDQRIDAGRFDLLQEVSVPFDLGPVRLRPYGLLDLTQYTEDLTGASRGRALGGGGASAAMTVSRLYRNTSSEIFNLRGLMHKATFWANYANIYSDTPYSQLPQFDRLNDDAIDQSMRTMNPYFPLYIAGPDALALQSAPQFDPQRYAIRRLVLNRVDTRDEIQVVQTGLFQRLQTKRGAPGREHTVDWMNLGVTASFFPDPNRDNFGNNAALLEFNYLWNVGDQTALTAAGWFDPYDPAAHYWTIGGFLQRPDGVNFYGGYRQTDPLNSKTVTITALYQLSKKYSFNLGASYDFGTQLALSNSLTIFRTGTDMTVGLGFSYNALVNNFGVNFVIVPNLATAAGYGRIGTPGMAPR